MNFSNFYFDKPVKTLLQKEQVTVDIDESEYNRLVELLNKDYSIVLESESYKDDYGYGYMYMLRDGESLLCLNRFKDEIDNTDARFFCSEEVSNMIRQKYNIQDKEE